MSDGMFGNVNGVCHNNIRSCQTVLQLFGLVLPSWLSQQCSSYCPYYSELTTYIWFEFKLSSRTSLLMLVNIGLNVNLRINCELPCNATFSKLEYTFYKRFSLISP